MKSCGYELEAKIIIVGLARLTLLPEKEKYLCFVEVKYRKNENTVRRKVLFSPTKIKTDL